MNGLWRLPAESADSPYPGLRPFMASERDIFFGREQMIDEVLMRLNEQDMVVVHGTSGCGKSSLISAGVLPQLATGHVRLELSLSIATFRPGAHPMQALADILHEAFKAAGKPVPQLDLQAILARARPRAGLAQLAADAGLDHLCIVIDQFEELFRVAENDEAGEAGDFADLLVRLCDCYKPETAWWEPDVRAEDEEPTGPARVSLILTMRSEFLGDCARYPGLAEAINRTQYLLPNMDRDDLIRAIREPAAVFDCEVAHDLAEGLADDALAEKDPLPLVQHALMQMWSDRRGETKTLTLRNYVETLRRSKNKAETDQPSKLGEILGGHADEVFREVAVGDAAMEEAVEFIFRALTVTDRQGRGVRYPQSFAHLVEISGVSKERTKKIVEAFRRSGVSFLTPYQGEGRIDDGTIIDISHEALIRSWPRINDARLDETARPAGWIQREAQDVLLWHWLAVEAGRYDPDDHPPRLLDAATVGRLAPWFDRIRKRPERARRYLTQQKANTDTCDQPEWLEVVKLIDDSCQKVLLDERRSRRGRRAALFALRVALPVAIVSASVFFFSWRSQEKATVAAEETANEKARTTERLNTEVNSLKQSLALAGTIGGSQPAAITERVGGQVPRGVERQVPVGETVYLWAGTRYTTPNLVNMEGHTVPPDDVRVNGRYRLAQNTVLRGGFPVGGVLTPPRGVLRAFTPVMVTRIRSFTVGQRTEFWIEAQRAGPPRGTVQIYFAPDVRRLRIGLWATLRDDLPRQLRRPGYDVEFAVSANAAGRLNSIFCRPEDRENADQLARTVTQWITNNYVSRYPELGTPRVTAIPGPEGCTPGRPTVLVLMIDFSPPPPPPPPPPPQQQPAPAATPASS